MPHALKPSIQEVRTHWQLLWRPQSLWHRLLRLALIATVPLALVAAFGVGTLLRQQQQEAERSTLAFGRAFASSVEADLDRSVAVLAALAASPLVESADVPAFRELSQRVLKTLPDWWSIVLADRSGRVLAHTAEGHQAVAEIVDQRSFARAVERRGPALGSLVHTDDGRWGIPVRYPIMRDGEVRYVLTGVLRPEAIEHIIVRQRVPADWVVSVFDGQQRRVARSRAGAETIGTAPTPSLRELMAGDAPEGVGTSVALEGDRVNSAYVRLGESGWVVAVGTSTAALQAALLRSLALYGGGILLTLLLGTALALVYAGGVSRPIARMRDAARAIGAGATPAPLPRSGILEVDDVGDALIDAAHRRQHSEAEREAARADAVTANRAKDEFLAILGHELRNPLAPIVTAVELMKRLHPEVAERERAIIERQVGHLRRLVDDLLDVSRIAQHKLQLHRHAVDLQHVVDKALETVDPAFANRAPLRIERPDGPVVVDGDDVRLTQVVCNLLVNAAKFTPPHGAIRLRLAVEGDSAVLAVSDEGAGIGPEMLPKVFDLFVQGEQALDRPGGGLGLGLGIVKGLVEMHGGSVAAHSQGAGRGARFTVRLPLLQREAEPEPAEPDREAARPPRRCVLLVDDNVDALQSLAALLRAAGHTVHEARDAASALAAVNDFEPDVALLDIGLPDVSGYELAAALRCDARFQALPIIALTGYGREPDRARALEGDFDEHLVKPVDAATLLGAIAHCTSRTRRGAAVQASGWR